MFTSWNTEKSKSIFFSNSLGICCYIIFETKVKNLFFSFQWDKAQVTNSKGIVLKEMKPVFIHYQVIVKSKQLIITVEWDIFECLDSTKVAKLIEIFSINEWIFQLLFFLYTQKKYVPR